MKTTLPLFAWLLDDPEFLAGRVDTTFLDRALAARDGSPLAGADAALHDMAAVAAALHLHFAARGAPSGTPTESGWTRAARAEALR